MKVIKKMIQIGNSDGIIIDTVIKNSLNIKRGDSVSFTIKKIIGR